MCQHKRIQAAEILVKSRQVLFLSQDHINSIVK